MAWRRDILRRFGGMTLASAGTADSFHPWNSCRLVNCFVARPPGSLGAGARLGNVMPPRAR